SHARATVERSVLFRKELETELEMRLYLAAVRVEMVIVETQGRIRRQQPASVGRKDIGVASDFVSGPGVLIAWTGIRLIAVVQHHGRKRLMVDPPPGADRFGRTAALNVVDLFDLDGRHVTIFCESGWYEPQRSPLVGTHGRNVHFRRLQD